MTKNWLQMKNYRIVKTDDGSQTYFSKLYNETCHSTSGAIEETKIHYIEGCEISTKIERPLNILEVGFGVGIGFLETLKAMSEKEFHFHSFEIDEELISLFAKANNILFEKKENIYIYKFSNGSLTIHLGNARETIKKIKGIKFHAIYQDAFSPKRNAILWTTEWFKDLKSLSHDSCILSTYSASSSIRKSLIAAGWSLYSGKNFGSKRSSTRARLYGDTEPEILDRLNRSHVEEITDENYLDYTLENN